MRWLLEFLIAARPARRVGDRVRGRERTGEQGGVTAMAPGRLYGVGVGPGDPELVTVRAARLIAEADVIAYHCARHGHSVARAAAAPYLRPGQAEEVLRYPVTTEDTDHPGGYAGALADFYTEAAGRLAAHLDLGRAVVVLCEGTRAFTVPTSISTSAWRIGSAHRSFPGSRRFPRRPRPVGEPLVQHDESLTVLPGTLPPELLRARMAAADGDAVAILKLGRTFDKVRDALADTGLLDRARYAERAGTDAQRVAPLADVDPATVPYMSLALVPGRGQRPEPPARRATVVGLGPGDPAWLTPESAAAIAAATDLVGYRAYLARVPSRPGQHRHASGNTVEADRAALALDLAAKGAPGRGDLLRRPRRVRDGLGGAGAGLVGPGTMGRRRHRDPAGRHRGPGGGQPRRRAARP